LKLKKRRETARISQRFTLADVECKSLGSRSSFRSSSSFEKVKKPKVVIFVPATFSKRYDSFQNNKKYSDFTIKYEASGESVSAHQFILKSNSDFFEKLDANNYTFPKEDDEAAAKALIKFYYTGSLDYSVESSVVSFMILANKYKTKNLSEFKVPAKVLLNGIISYIEKDLNNRVGEFDSLAESVDFKKMEKEDLTKMYAKKKMVTKKFNFLKPNYSQRYV